jgi:LysR family glycine cleavage system transcriptional activator
MHMPNAKRFPSLKALKVFQEAGRHLSFKRAAEELFITPSAVSHQVRNLEHYLGVELFVRKTRSLEFTDAGRRYFTFLDEMFARLEAETHQLFVEYGRGLIRLCVPPFFANELLLPKLHTFQAQMPDTDIRLTTQPSLMKAHPAEADLSILLGNDEWPDLVTHRLFQWRLVVACAPSLLPSLDPGAFESLNGQTLIVHENRPRSWEYWARAVGTEPPRAGKIIRFDSMSALVQAAAQGLGVALVSWPLSRNWFESGALVRVFDEVVETGEYFYLAHRPGEHERMDIAKLIEWIIDAFGTHEKN